MFNIKDLLQSIVPLFDVMPSWKRLGALVSLLTVTSTGFAQCDDYTQYAKVMSRINLFFFLCSPKCRQPMEHPQLDHLVYQKCVPQQNVEHSLASQSKYAM
jgi:hypothetical protein